ncbi:MAG: sulfotransferase family protein [Schleiferiaceae bacterium]|nr:sulfotransferase family protein [Schleiferiaceae bacterium]
MVWNALFKTQLELISFHVPKTAGTSFGAVLRVHYGKSHQDIYEEFQMDRLRKGMLPKVHRGIKAIHGHMPAVVEWKNEYPNAKRVCWIRDPLERLFSLYNFWQQNPSVKGKIKYQFDREKPSFEAFICSNDYVKPVMAYQRYLGAVPPSFFHFIGEMEHYTEDLVRFEQLLKIPTREVQQNQTAQKKHLSIDPKLVSTILQSEYRLYNELKQAAISQRNRS